MTKEQPSRILGLTRGLQLLTATLAVSAFAAIAALPVGDTGSSHQENSAAVELLDATPSGTPVTLAQLRADVLGDGRFGASDGSGIDVAIIDSGVALVDGLDRTGKVLHGPDLSTESTDRDTAFIDNYGHGTHMAGIIAGERDGAAGIAPGARLISIKVAGRDGETAVAQVVAAIDWVVEHRDDDGLNIRILNLSLGVSDITTHEGDVLSAAAERAWDAGIFVVAAAGNNGDAQQHLDSPAIDPYLMAVGAVDSSTGFNPQTQLVPDWSATGDGNRNPDIVAPGRSIASYRVAGSAIDIAAPEARLDGGFFLGSGTSQAAAVISGLAARALGAYPDLDPDDLKATFANNALAISSTEATRRGHGRVDGDNPEFDTQDQKHPRAAGEGTGLEIGDDSWSGGEWSGSTWSGGTWSGSTWSGSTWSGTSWSGTSWSGTSWSGTSWSGTSWSGTSWSGTSWSGTSWSGTSWSGTSWSGTSWSTAGWS